MLRVRGAKKVKKSPGAKRMPESGNVANVHTAGGGGVGGGGDDGALLRNVDGGEGVVASHHDRANRSGGELLDHRLRCRLCLVFENEHAEESQAVLLHHRLRDGGKPIHNCRVEWLSRACTCDDAVA